jgi:hypothetical protein
MSAHSRHPAIMNNHASRLGLAGADGSGWNGSRASKYPPLGAQGRFGPLAVEAHRNDRYVMLAPAPGFVFWVRHRAGEGEVDGESDQRAGSLAVMSGRTRPPIILPYGGTAS